MRHKSRNTIAICLLLGLVVAGLYGCGAEATPTPMPPTATLEPPTAISVPPTATTGADTGGGGGMASGPAAELLKASGAAMKEVKTYHLTIASTSGMDAAAAASASAFSAEGDFEAPDKMRLSIKMAEGSGITGTVEMIVIGSDTYMKQPGTESYMALGGEGNPFSEMLKFGSMQDTDDFAQLSADASVVGDETLDGVETTHLTFSSDPSDMTPVEGMPAGKSTGEIWIEKSTKYIRQIKITSLGAANPQANPVATGDSTVTITYSKINEPITPPIEKPANITTMPEIPGMPELPTVPAP